MEQPARQPVPTIKGIFVRSHIQAVRKAKGPAGLAALKRGYGKPMQYKNFDDVPVREEVKIIEAALDVLHPHVPPDQRAFEAGRLHFKNFSTTALGRMVLSALPRNFKLLLMRSRYIAQQVFKHVAFTSIDLGPKSLRVVMENNDYPLEHFQGFFQAWLDWSGLSGQVDAAATGSGRYEYTFVWR